MKDYLSAEGRLSHEIVIQKSRFIATLTHAEGLEAAQEFLKEIKREYPTATHHCFAYIGCPEGTEMRFSDDGEPQGTAGQPMLEVLKKKGLYCTAAVVTRYFGGVKLGAGGLVSAYTRAVAEAADMIKTVCYRLSVVYNLICPYSGYQALVNALKGLEYSVLNCDFGDNVTMSVAVPEENATRFTDIFGNALMGTGEMTELARGYYKYEI